VTPNSNVQRVWLILVKVTVVTDNPTHLTVGSEALVQCFVPEMATSHANLESEVLTGSYQSE